MKKTIILKTAILSAVLLQLKADFIGNGLHLFGICGSANHKEIGEGSDARKVKNLDVSGFFGLGCAHGQKPRGL